MLVAALGVFLARLRQARGLARAQLQYLAVGIIVSAAGGVGANLVLPLLTGRSDYSWIGPAFSLSLVAFTSHAIIRHRLMDVRIVVSRWLISVTTIGLVAAIVLSLARLIAPDSSTQSLTLTLDVLAAAVISLAVLTSTGQRLIHAVVDPYLYRGRLDSSSGLRLATHRLSQLMEPAELADKLHRVLAEAFIPESFVMASRSADSEELQLLAAIPQEVSQHIKLPDLLSILRTVPPSRRSLLICQSGQDEGLPSLTQLQNLGIAVLVLLRRRNEVLGLLLLGPRRSGDPYYKSDLVFIESLGELASIALENSLLYRQKLEMLEYSDRLLESIDAAVVAIDSAGRITSSNPAAQSLFHLSSPAASDLRALPSEVGWALALAVQGEWRPQEVEVSIDHPARGVVPIILSTAVLHSERGGVTGALVVATDLSRVKELERSQRRIEHLATMARFYAGIAHEIRSPLASISNFIAMLPDRFDDPEYRDTAVRLLPSEVARIVALADRLRSMAPSDGGKLARVKLQPLIGDLVALYSASAIERGVTIEFRADTALPDVLGDASQLVQLFVNLLRNAIEAMPAGGTVTIEARRDTEAQRADLLTVDVTDEGVGIDPTARPNIFDPFFTTKPSGTGLGLAICREIAEFHGATLRLFSWGHGRGTCARVTFVCAPPDAELERSALSRAATQT